ncbi:MAG: YnbE family lipoprotein [Rickettsiales bacterium]
MQRQISILALAFMMMACTPTVQLQAPDKPIEINLNVKVEQHVRVSIEKDVNQTIKKRKDIF